MLLEQVASPQLSASLPQALLARVRQQLQSAQAFLWAPWVWQMFQSLCQV